MSPSLMDPGDNSPGSLTAEETFSQAHGSERKGEVGHTGGQRRVKNRDAARRTRRKQTDRADELHEELQQLEKSNSALQKEIAALRKDFQCFTAILAHHEPRCHLRPSTADSAKKPRLDGPAPSLGVAPEGPGAILAPPSAPSPFLTSGLDPLILSASAASPDPLSMFSSFAPCDLTTAAPAPTLTPPPAGDLQIKQTCLPPPPYPHVAGELGGPGPLCPLQGPVPQVNQGPAPPADPLGPPGALIYTETSFLGPLDNLSGDEPCLTELLEWLMNDQ